MPAAPKYAPRPKASSAARGYGHRHRQARRQVLAAQGGLCAWCRDAAATDLHHADGNTANLSRPNLVALCERCHHGGAHGGQ